jgi:hypothetical protein
MLLNMIQLLAGDQLLNCVVIRETANDWTVRKLDGSFDPEEYAGPKAFHRGWLRISKTNDLTEPLETTFDTATLHDIPREIAEAVILRGESASGKLFHEVRESLEVLSTITTDDTNSAVSSLMEYRRNVGAVDGLDILAARIIESATGFAGYELRLNGAGLKLFTTIWVEDELLQVNMRIGGDQSGSYPKFVKLASACLKELRMQADG